MNKTVGRITQEINCNASTWARGSQDCGGGDALAVPWQEGELFVVTNLLFLIGWEYILPPLILNRAVPQEARHRAHEEHVQNIRRFHESLQQAEAVLPDATTDWPHRPCPRTPPFWLLSGETPLRRDMRWAPGGWAGAACSVFSISCCSGMFCRAFDLYVSVKVDLEPRRVLHRWICLSLVPSIPSGLVLANL